MITQNDILRISEPVEQMYMDCTSQLIINLCSHFKVGSDTTNWEIQKLSELDAVTQESIKIIAANTGQSEEVIRQAITEATGIELKDAETVLQSAAKAGTIQAATTTLSTSPMVASVVRTLTEQAKNDTNIVNTVMLNSTREKYVQAVSDIGQVIEQTFSITSVAELDKKLATTQKAINAATLATATGAEVRANAVRQVVAELAAEGITGYIDKAGRKWSPEAYINMDIRTTVHNAAVQAQKDRSAEFGVTTFQISSHLGARPLCAPYQGKFYSWDNTSGVVEDLYGRKYSYQGINSTSYGEPAGIFGINCGHNPQTFVDGYSIPRYGPTEDFAENERIYKLTQQQRAKERQIRQYETEALGLKAAGDQEGYRLLTQKVNQYKTQYRAFCKDNNLTYRSDRLLIGGYDAKAAKVTKTAPKVVNGKDISTTFVRDPSKFEFEIDDVLHAQGFDGLPRVIPAADFDKAVKQANGGKGFIAQRTYSAPTQEAVAAYREQLYRGEWYVDCTKGGTAAYGQGMYATGDFTGRVTSTMEAATDYYMKLNMQKGNPAAAVETFTLASDARVAAYPQLREEFKQYGMAVQTRNAEVRTVAIKDANKALADDLLRQAGLEGNESARTFLYGNLSLENVQWTEMGKAYSALGEKAEAVSQLQAEFYKRQTEFVDAYVKSKLEYEIQDIGSYAASLGYDAIEVAGYGVGESTEVVVLNRTKVIFKEP